MNLIRCDQCKLELDPLIRHFVLEGKGITHTLGDWPGPGHFCSWKCLSLFAGVRAIDTDVPGQKARA